MCTIATASCTPIMVVGRKSIVVQEALKEIRI